MNITNLHCNSMQWTMKRTIPILLLIIIHSVGLAQTVIKKDTRFLRDRMSKLALITQVPHDSLRGAVISSVMDAFEKKHIDIVNADAFVSPDSSTFYSTLEREFTENHVDGIMIIKIVDVGLTDMYIFPGDVLPPDAYNYYEFYSVYYYYDLPDIGVPGYLYRQDRRFRFDINVYANKGDMIVLAAQSSELQPMKDEKVVRSLGKKMAGILLSNRLVVKK